MLVLAIIYPSKEAQDRCLKAGSLRHHDKLKLMKEVPEPVTYQNQWARVLATDTLALLSKMKGQIERVQTRKADDHFSAEMEIRSYTVTTPIFRGEHAVLIGAAKPEEAVALCFKKKGKLLTPTEEELPELVGFMDFNNLSRVILGVRMDGKKAVNIYSPNDVVAEFEELSKGETEALEGSLMLYGADGKYHKPDEEAQYPLPCATSYEIRDYSQSMDSYTQFRLERTQMKISKAEEAIQTFDNRFGNQVTIPAGRKELNLDPAPIGVLHRHLAGSRFSLNSTYNTFDHEELTLLESIDEQLDHFSASFKVTDDAILVSYMDSELLHGLARVSHATTVAVALYHIGEDPQRLRLSYEEAEATDLFKVVSRTRDDRRYWPWYWINIQDHAMMFEDLDTRECIQSVEYLVCPHFLPTRFSLGCAEDFLKGEFSESCMLPLMEDISSLDVVQCGEEKEAMISMEEDVEVSAGCLGTKKAVTFEGHSINLPWCDLMLEGGIQLLKAVAPKVNQWFKEHAGREDQGSNEIRLYVIILVNCIVVLVLVVVVLLACVFCKKNQSTNYHMQRVEYHVAPDGGSASIRRPAITLAHEK